MFNKRLFLVLFLLIIAIGTVSSVSAGDVIDDALDDSGDNSIELNDNNDLNEVSDDKTDIDTSEIISGSDVSDKTLKMESDDKSFTQLQELIDKASPGSTISLDANYTFMDGDSEDGIIINKTLTINGNDHLINAYKECRIFSIEGDNVVLNNITFLNGWSSYEAGCLWIRNNLTTINNCFFAFCLSDYGSVIDSTAKLIISESVFYKNYAYECGGAIYTTNELIISNTNFNDNNATNGGAIYGVDKIKINNCLFECNNVTKDGGAIYACDELIINHTLFEDNNAKDEGGAIYARYPYDGYKSLNLTNSIFYWNYASNYGGAVYLDCFKNNGDFENGAAKSYIKNTTFDFNGADYGGAIFNFQQSEIIDSAFTRNYAHSGGGAIYLNNGQIEENDTYAAQTFGLEIHGNTSFINNTAGRYGGAIKIYAYSVPLEKGIKGILKIYDNVLFQNNSATTGGALSIIDSDSLIKNAVFIKNSADENGSAINGGLAVNCTFKDNSDPATYDTEVINTAEGKLTLSQSGSYYGDKTLTVTLVNKNTNEAIADASILLKTNGKEIQLYTNAKGQATYNVPFTPGTYSATASVNDDDIKASAVTLNGIKIAKAPITITPTKLSTTYASGKNFQVKVINSKTKKVVSGTKLSLKVYTGKKYKTVTVKTNSKGIATYAASTLAIGTHKIIVSNAQTNLYTGSAKTSSVKISKASYNIIAPTVTNGYKQAGSFKITVKNKASGKVVSGVKLTVKVYTGKKYKTYSLKTNSKGVATISTKALTKTTHKVVISTPKTTYYNAASKSSSIKIVNKIATKLYVGDSNTWFTGNYGGGFLIAAGHVELRTSSGKLLANKKLSYVCRIGSFSGTVIDSGTFNSSASTDDYSRNMWTNPGGHSSPLYYTIKFSGDGLYSASSTTFVFKRYI